VRAFCRDRAGLGEYSFNGATSLPLRIRPRRSYF
jgi:hypothetical protein